MIRLFLLGLLTWLQGLCLAAPFELERATSFAQSQPRSFYLVVFATKRCPWCALLKRDYLIPLPAKRDGISIRLLEVLIDQDNPLIDFKGKPTTHKRFAQTYGVRVSPTVMVFGPNPEPLGTPLVGVGIADFYGAYLDDLIQVGIASQTASQTSSHTPRQTVGSEPPK